MKTTKFKKFMALLLTGMMALSMFSGVALADETPADYEATKTYVMNYSTKTGIEGYEDWDNKRLYDTPYRTDIWVTEDEATGDMGNWNWCTSSVLNMIDLTKLPEGGEGPYASIPVYCVDAITDGKPGVEYRRMNLEDSTYFDDEVAGRIRAIFMNSFPYIKDMDAITAAVNAWNAENGSKWGEVKELNKYEVISATQGVIWTITNNGYLSDDCFAGIVRTALSRENESVYHGYQREGNADAVYVTDYTRNNINAVARYLEALAPMAPQATVISETAFEDLTIKKVEEADGTYTLTVSVKVVVDEKATSDLKLTAVLDGKVFEVIEGIKATGEYTFVIPGTTANSTVKLAIDGTQTAGDVYLYDPVNGREESQTMAGYDKSAKPVHAEIGIGPERIINFNKIGRVEKDGVTTSYPLEGIQFEIYYAGTVDDYTAFAATMAGKTAEEIQAAFTAKAVDNKAGDPIVVTTDATGKATHSFGNDGKADGIYLIIERENPAIMTPLAPFVVALPMTSADGNGLSYVLNLQPKNKVYPGPEVDKYITEIGKELDSFNIGETHTWIVCGDIPVDMATAKSYVLTDTMDYRLTYVADSVEVSAVKGEVSVDLIAGTDYVLTVGKSKDADKNEIDIIKVELTKAGREKAAAYKGGKVNVSFDAIIDEDADNAAGVVVPNEVTLDYENTVGVEFSDEDDAKIFTCAINIFKHDAKNAEVALSGATFKLAKVVAEGTEGAAQLVTGKGSVAWVVYEEFYNSAVIAVDDPATEEVNEATAKVNFVVTDVEGKAMLYGLAAGEYYLVETKAPAGYNLLSYPIKVTVGTAVDAETQKVELSTADAIREVKVANSNTFVLPETGGIGTVIFTVSGGLMTLAGGAILTLKKREEE